jgi:hypothetical protein
MHNSGNTILQKVDVCWIQETRYRSGGCGTIKDRDTWYKLNWSENVKSTAAVGVLVAIEWIEKVLEIADLRQNFLSETHSRPVCVYHSVSVCATEWSMWRGKRKHQNHFEANKVVYQNIGPKSSEVFWLADQLWRENAETSDKSVKNDAGVISMCDDSKQKA